jgi:hypothetical protein
MSILPSNQNSFADAANRLGLLKPFMTEGANLKEAVEIKVTAYDYLYRTDKGFYLYAVEGKRLDLDSDSHSEKFLIVSKHPPHSKGQKPKAFEIDQVLAVYKIGSMTELNEQDIFHSMIIDLTTRVSRSEASLLRPSRHHSHTLPAIR